MKSSAHAAHRDFVRGLISGKPADAAGAALPGEGWTRATWHAAGAESSQARAPQPLGDPHEVEVHLPPGFAWSAGTRRAGIENPLAKAAGSGLGSRECDGGRWITVHPHGPDEKGHPVYVCPNPDGSHTVVGGAGGRLNGLRLVGVKSHDEYKQRARDKRDADRRKQSLEDDIRKKQVGVERFQREQEEKKATVAESASSSYETERNAIAAVFAAQGIDPSLQDVPKESLAGVDADTAATIQRRYHQKLLTYAKHLGDSIRDLVAAGLDGISEGATGDLGVGNLAHGVSHGSGGRGYASPVRALAAEYGLTDDARGQVVEGVRLRSLLDRSEGMSLETARGRQEANKERAAARRESEAKVKEAVASLAEEGVGPAALAQLPTAPQGIRTMGDAVAVLKALKEAEAARASHRRLVRAVQGVHELEELPKAALVVAKEMTDGEAKAAIADDIAEDARRRAMVSLVTSDNGLEDQHGSIAAHRSIGHNLAMNTVLSAVDGSSVDPLLHDVLGVSGAARVLVGRWRDAMTPEQFEQLGKTVEGYHVRTQEAVARGAVQEAQEYLGQAEAIDPDRLPPTTPEELSAALMEHDQRTRLIERARETLAIARGRLEAVAALSEAMRQPAGADIPVSLGAVAAGDAVTAMYALGLNEPTVFDRATGEPAADRPPGEWSLFHDGKNAVVTLTPAAARRLAGGIDQRLVERADRSRAIKRGDFDEPDWLPEGLSRRPVSSYEVDPLEVRRTDISSGIAPGDSPEDAGRKLRLYAGALMNAGRDPAQIESHLRSEEFLAGLGLSGAEAAGLQAALREMSPQWIPDPAVSLSGDSAAARAEIERYRQFQEGRKARYQGFLQEHLAARAAAGDITADEAALDAQHLPLDATVHDCAYVAALSDPRLRFAFHKPGDLTRDGREAVRRWAYEHLFGLDPKTDGDQPITPLSPEQQAAWRAWNELGDREGEHYAAIQGDWRRRAEEQDGGDLFGDPTPPHPLSVVDLSDGAAVLGAARTVPQLLGYQAVNVPTPDGRGIEKRYPDLEATADRPESVLVQEARGRIRGALRQHFLSEMLGLPDLAAQGFHPGTVRTASGRFAEYARSMGETNAYRTVQEFMRGELSRRFAGEYAKRTGTQLAVATRPVEKAERHAEAMLPPQAREALSGMDAAARAKYLNRFRGKFAKTEGGVRDQAEAQKLAGQEGAALFDAQDPEGRNVVTERPSIGRSAENVLAGILPHIDVAPGGVQAAAGLNFSGERGAPIQRAIRLIEANKRQGVNLGTGLGKTVVGFGAFTHLRSKGAAKRALFLTPSNVVDQYVAEMDKFRDPSVPLFKAGTSGMSAGERRAALANPNLHALVTTPETLREDVVHAVAVSEGVTPEEAAARIMGEEDEAARFDLIHRALDAAGYSFDYVAADEGHRLLSRAGKPDALMQRIGDAVFAKAGHFAYLTADPAKNDASEVWDVLHKLDPERHPQGSRDEFMRKYGRSTVAAGLALQRAVEPYLYPERADIGVETDDALPDEGRMKLTPEQQAAHDGVLAAYNRARQAKLRGGLDIAALRELSPSSFEGVTGTADSARVAEGLNAALGTLRDSALARVVDAFPGGAKENYVSSYLGQHRGEPSVVFAHRLEAVKNISERLRREGHRVSVMTGEMAGSLKTRARLMFQPAKGEPQADVIVLSDAGAMGANLQRGVHVLNVDVPQTAMLHQQRVGRIRRIGQKSARIYQRDLVTDTEHDQRARARLADKSALREILTSPSSSVDDSGLAAEIERAGLRRVIAEAGRKAAA